MSVPPLGPGAGDSHVGHSGSGPLNVNFGDGRQINNTLSGGSGNTQFIAEELHYYETHNTARAETPPLPTHNVPFQRDPAFVGRSELDDVQDKLSQPGARVSLVGLGGVGKSQIAIEYCYWLRQQQPDTWVLWIHTSNAARFDQDVRKLAALAKIPGRDVKDVNIFQLVHDWLMDGRRRWLIVLDNADDADFLFEAPQGLSNKSTLRMEYLPVCNHGSILITTRRQVVASGLSDKHNIIALQPDQQHATRLLQSRLSHEHDSDTAKRLAAALEYMPLAIAQATAYIEKRWPRCSLEKYLNMFEESDKSKLSLLKVESAELRRDKREAKNAILITWQISFEQIYADRRTAADLLSLMSFYDYQGIPDVLLRAGLSHSRSIRRDNDYRIGDDDEDETHDHDNQDQDHDNQDQDQDVDKDENDSDSNRDSEMSIERGFEDDIDTLRDYSFVSFTTDGSILEMHRLIQLATQLWLKSKKEFNRWEARSLQTLNNSFPPDEFEFWGQYRALLPHAKLLLQSKTKDREALLNLSSICYQTGGFLRTQGTYVEAEGWIRHSMEIRQAILGPEDSRTLNTMDMFGTVLTSQGNYKLANAVLEQTLRGREDTLGRTNVDTLGSVHELATVSRYQGRLDDAEQLYRRATDGCMEVLGSQHKLTLVSMNGLASVLKDLGRYQEAEEMHRRELEGSEKVFGSEHPETLTSINNLALVLQHQGAYEEAEEMYRRTSEARMKWSGSEHPDTLTSISNLASVLADQGKHEEAEEMHRRALEGSEKVLGSEHPSTLTSINNLALVLRKQGNYEQAEALNRRALEAREKVLGGEHLVTLMSVDNLALVLQTQGSYEEAEALNRRALGGFEKVLGEEHPDTLTSVWNFAILQEELGNHDSALELYQRAASGFAKVLGASHPYTIRCGLNLRFLEESILNLRGPWKGPSTS